MSVCFFAITAYLRCPIELYLLTFYEIAKIPLIFYRIWFKIDLALGDKEC